MVESILSFAQKSRLGTSLSSAMRICVEDDSRLLNCPGLKGCDDGRDVIVIVTVNSKMCAFSALHVGIRSIWMVQYLHRKKNQELDQGVWCKYCTVAGGGDILKWSIYQNFWTHNWMEKLVIDIFLLIYSLYESMLPDFGKLFLRTKWKISKYCKKFLNPK